MSVAWYVGHLHEEVNGKRKWRDDAQRRTALINQLTAAICLIYHALNLSVTSPTSWQLPSFLTWCIFKTSFLFALLYLVSPHAISFSPLLFLYHKIIAFTHYTILKFINPRVSLYCGCKYIKVVVHGLHGPRIICNIRRASSVLSINSDWIIIINVLGGHCIRVCYHRICFTYNGVV